MTKLDFENKTLERWYMGLRWARNNSLQLFDAAEAAHLFDWQPEGVGQHGVLYQFQCLVTTTDTYYRRISGYVDTHFGILVDEKVVEKCQIAETEVKLLLNKQLQNLEALFRSFDVDKLEIEARNIQAIANHEYLHQGQLVVLFRQAGVLLPERFRVAFDL